MGLSSSEQDLERVATEMIEELELRNSRPLDPDLLALFVDGKYVEWREGDKLRSACIYLAIGLGRDGKKRVLSCVARPGRENRDDWKRVLRGLIERGLRRVMMLIQDDFSGLLPISQRFFPHADVQLCAVHMQRNAKTHLSQTHSTEFQQRWRAIKSSWDVDVGNRQFEELCLRFAKAYPTWMGELRKKREHYLAFWKYPESMRKSFSTTNVVEAINGQLEIMPRNSGGYFHSEETLTALLPSISPKTDPFIQWLLHGSSFQDDGEYTPALVLHSLQLLILDSGSDLFQLVLVMQATQNWLGCHSIFFGNLMPMFL